MNKLPASELALISGETSLTDTAEEGRDLAMLIARHAIHNIKLDLGVLKDGRERLKIQIVLLQ